MLKLPLYDPPFICRNAHVNSAQFMQWIVSQAPTLKSTATPILFRGGHGLGLQATKAYHAQEEVLRIPMPLWGQFSAQLA